MITLDKSCSLPVELDGVRAGEDGPARILVNHGRLWVVAWNQGGHDCAGVDLGDLLKWLEKHPEIAGFIDAI